jgi:hypothetical protein
MGTESLAENTPNAPEFICPIACPSPKVLDFNEKRRHWVSVVREEEEYLRRKEREENWIRSFFNNDGIF